MVHWQQAYVAQEQRMRNLSHQFVNLSENYKGENPAETQSLFIGTESRSFFRRGGRPIDLTSYYSAPGAKYTVRASDRQILARHQEQYYCCANLCHLDSKQGLENLIVIIDTQSLAGFF